MIDRDNAVASAKTARSLLASVLVTAPTPLREWLACIPASRSLLPGTIRHRLSAACRIGASSVPGVTSRWARSPAGSNRASAARTARSAQSGFGRATCRRTTATS